MIPVDRAVSFGGDMDGDPNSLPRPTPTMPSPGVPPKLGTPPPTSGSASFSYDFTGAGQGTTSMNSGSAGLNTYSTGGVSPGGTLFDALDRNHDGVITRAEWSAAVSSSRIQSQSNSESVGFIGSSAVIADGGQGNAMDTWRSVQVGPRSHSPTVSRGITPISSALGGPSRDVSDVTALGYSVHQPGEKQVLIATVDDDPSPTGTLSFTQRVAAAGGQDQAFGSMPSSNLQQVAPSLPTTNDFLTPSFSNVPRSSAPLAAGSVSTAQRMSPALPRIEEGAASSSTLGRKSSDGQVLSSPLHAVLSSDMLSEAVRDVGVSAELSQASAMPAPPSAPLATPERRQGTSVQVGSANAGSASMSVTRTGAQVPIPYAATPGARAAGTNGSMASASGGQWVWRASPASGQGALPESFNPTPPVSPLKNRVQRETTFNAQGSASFNNGPGMVGGMGQQTSGQQTMASREVTMTNVHASQEVTAADINVMPVFPAGAQERTCSECGTVLSADSVFCHMCGAARNAATAVIQQGAARGASVATAAPGVSVNTAPPEQQTVERVVREVVEKPVYIERVVEKLVYVPQQVERVIYKEAGVPVQYRRVEVPPDFLDYDFPYHHPLPEQGCGWMGHIFDPTNDEPILSGKPEGMVHAG